MAAACSWACGGCTALFGGRPDCPAGDLNSETDATGNDDTEADANTSGRQTVDFIAGGDTSRRKTHRHNSDDNQSSGTAGLGHGGSGTELASHLHV